MNLTVNVERSPRRQVAGSNPVTPMLLTAHVFGLRPDKQQDRPALCRFLRESCRIDFAVIMPENRRDTNTEYPGFCFMKKNSPLVPKQAPRERYYKTGRGRDNWTGCM